MKKKEDNILKKLWDKIKIEQIHKFLRVVIICMIFMVLSEAIFEIPAVANFFGEGLLEGQTGWLVYVIIWLVMFAQVAIIPIPALPILVACSNIPKLVARDGTILGLFSFETLGFLALVVSASLVGAITAYWIGRTLGRPAVKWVAGSDEDYKKWSKKLNTKTGKWIYAGTVLLPIFPDDLISFVVGSVKMNFGFYVIVNAICKTIGLFTMLLFMRIPGISIFFNDSETGFPIALTAYIAILVIAIVWRLLLNRKLNRNQSKENKLEVVKEQVLNKLKKKENVYKQLIIDYKINKKFKTYFATPVKIEKLFVSDKAGKKTKVRIIVKCEACNYWEIIFDKKYRLTETYDTLIKDFKECDF